MSNWRRAIAGTTLAWVPAAVLVGTAALWWDRLPTTLPTHWSGITDPDGFSARTTVWTALLAVAVVAALGVTVVAVLRPGSAWFSWLMVGAGFVAATCALMWVIFADATLRAGNAEHAQLGWRLSWILGAFVWAALCYWVVGAVRRPAAPEHEGPSIALTPGERAVWSTTMAPRVLTAAGVVGLVVVALAALFTGPQVWPVMVAPVLVLAVFSRIEVTVDRRGLRLVAGLLRLPFKRIGLDQIASAAAQDVRPAEWGGWGYRIMPGRSALVLRAGPGMVVHQRDGREFAVTLRDPQTPAALLNALRGADAGA